MVQTSDSVVELQMTVQLLMQRNLLQSEVTNILTPLVQSACDNDRDLVSVFAKHGWDADQRHFRSPVNLVDLNNDLSLRNSPDSISCRQGDSNATPKKNWTDIDWAYSRFSSERLGY